MARAISVKIPTASLIATLEAKIAEIDKAIADHPKALKKHAEDLKAWEKEVVKYATKMIAKYKNDIGCDVESAIRVTNNYRNQLQLDLSATLEENPLPERPYKPEAPNGQRWYGRDHQSPKSLLEKNLKILRMTSQEEVSASTYGAVMELL